VAAPAERGTLHALVRGRVQGVGFRWFVRAQARELGLQGWCANLGDGGVEVWAEGAADALDQLAARLRSGPPAARVDEVRLERDGAAVHVAPEHARVAF